MNTHTGTYYWPDTFTRKPEYPALTENIRCDVLIVGGGSSGAQCAYYLADQGLQVVLIEKNFIGYGSTVCNTSLLQYSGEKLFTDLVHSFGDSYMTRHLKACMQAVDDLENASNKLNIDAQFKRRDTLYYVSQKKDEAALKQEWQWLKGKGAPVEWVGEDWIQKHYSFQKKGAIYSHHDAEVNPFRLTHGLIDYAVTRGVKVFEHTGMTGAFVQDGQPVIRTDGNFMIRANQVIYACGYETMDIKPEKQASFVSTYTVTTKPVQNFTGWYNRTLIWETARPYNYLRTTADDRIIIGGLDENTDKSQERDKMLVHKRDQLMEEFMKLFPEIRVEPDYVSAAFYGGMRDGLPILGEYEEYPNSYFLLGYGDNGTVYSMMLAKILKELILDGKSNNQWLYHQDRPLKN